MHDNHTLLYVGTGIKLLGRTQFLLKADGSNMAPDTSSPDLAAPFSAGLLSLKVPLLSSTDASLAPEAYASGTGNAPPALALVETMCFVLRSKTIHQA